MPAPGIATSNPFAVLNTKKALTREKEDRKPTQRKDENAKKPAAAKTPAADTKKKPEIKPAPGKVMSLADMQKAEDEKRQAEKDKKKEEKTEHKIQKENNAKTDRQDRSGKGHQQRKEGKGTGGWDDATPAPEPAAEDVAAAEPKSPASGEEAAKAAEEEAKAAELEEKQMTLDEYLATKESVSAQFNIRQVDSAGFANMKRANKSSGNETFKILTKQAPTKSEPKEKAPQPKDTKTDKVAQKKEGMALSGFKMENPARQRGNRDFPAGGRGGRGGRGFGRGRGGQQANEATTAAAPQIDNEELFPALGGARAAAAPAEAN